MAEGKTDLADINFDLEEIDDEEFNIPQVEAPTLESILNESDNEELDPHSLEYDDSQSVSSIESQDTPKKKRKPISAVRQASAILRHIVLKSVSAQLSSAVDRVSAGSPTVLAVRKLLAVGTSHGLVLIFDPNQSLKWCLGSSVVGAQYGAVTALTFDKTSTRLLCGFAKSVITMWDTTNGKLLRTITDAHPPGTAILNLQFTDSHTLAVSSDSGGSVFELEFKKLIAVRSCESRCLFSGSRGEVCCVKALHTDAEPNHPLMNLGVIAMGTLSKLLLVTLRPQLKVVYAEPLSGSPSTLPLLAWQFVVIQLNDGSKVFDPVLAFARQHSIHFVQLICRKGTELSFNKLKKITVDYTLLNIAWLNTRALILLDQSEKFHILDIRNEFELDVVDVANIRFVYSSSFYKSLATGGNVSKAMAYAADVACYSSIATHSKQLLLLGVEGVHVYSLRTWKERIDAVVKTGYLDEALKLAVSFYAAKHGETAAVLGLPVHILRRKMLVRKKVIELANQYVNWALRLNGDEEFWDYITRILAESLINVEERKELVRTIYSKLENNAVSKKAFLENVEPFVINGKAPDLGPSVMKDLVEYYESTDQLHRLEACLNQVDMSTIDTNRVVQLCWSFGLYDAFISVYNKGLNDYSTPIEKLANLLENSDESDEMRKLGNKLLVYISCSLAGAAYPIGDIKEENKSKVKLEVFDCVTRLHSNRKNEDETSYPYIRTLLRFDTVEFLNVLALASRSEKEFNGENPEGADRLQRLLDILLRVMVESERRFESSQTAALFTFVTRLLARNRNVIVSRGLLEKLLLSVPAESRATPGGQVRHDEREQALQELLDNGGDEYFDEDRLLELCEHAKFYKVCRLIYEKRRRFGDVWRSLWSDSNSTETALNYLYSVLMNNTPNLTGSEREDVKSTCTDHIAELVKHDADRAAKFVLLGLFKNIKIASNALEDPKDKYHLLNSVIQLSPNQDSDIHNELIELMAEFQPNFIESHLRKVYSQFDPNRAIEICKKKNIISAVAFLYEKDGMLMEAYETLFTNVQKKLNQFIEAGKDSFELQKAVETVSDLCRRHSKVFDGDNGKKLWFRLLDVLLAADEFVKNRIDSLAEVCQNLLRSMVGHVPLSDIVQRLMQTRTGTFSQVRPLLTALLANYNYEMALLNICRKLVESDAARHLKEYHDLRGRAITPSIICCLCNGIIENDSICFKCGHTYHLNCLQKEIYCRLCARKKPKNCHVAVPNRQPLKIQSSWTSNSENLSLELRLKPPPPYMAKE